MPVQGKMAREAQSIKRASFLAATGLNIISLGNY
jgi:hypothetical protein